MSTVEVKIKKIHSLAIIFIISAILWQGVGLYDSRVKGINIRQYFYTKIISNVIPSAVLPEQEDDALNGLNKVLYLLTDINPSHYKSFIEKNIPLVPYTAMLDNPGDNKGLVGFSKLKKKEELKEEDYFDQSEELAVKPYEQHLVVDANVTQDQLADDSYVLQKLINFDANLNHENQAMNILDIPKLAQKEFRLDRSVGGPQVLILHTHSMERFVGEEPGSQGVVDLGRYLKETLESQYGVSVLHCTSSFDVVDNRTERTGSYERMEPVIGKIIQDNPSIQLVMDIHRDGILTTDKFLTDVNGKSTAKMMFVNGFCQVQQNGVLTPIDRLPNPYVEDNMAFSLKLQLRANELYPGFMRKTLVKPYRYSLHMRPMSLLIEVGNQNNIKEEALNTMEVLAEILFDVIEKD